ncbi:MAG: hypothetical protein ACR2NN_09690 [Bryobacteraceae bacterium]
MYKRLCYLFLIPVLLPAQTKSEFQQILERLDRVEQENRGLAAEVRALRQELAAARSKEDTAIPAVPLDERVATAEHRIAEQAQTKVEASQRMPVSLTGMLLFNAFLNGRQSGDDQDPLVASLTRGAASGGASLRQTVLGLKFEGPEIPGGGKVSGDVYMDFFSGSSSSLNHLLRLRVASIDVDWKNQSILFGQDKPIIAPREPNSLAQVGFSPLTGAGNLWLWGPQVRFEQRFAFGGQTTFRGQVGVYETSEPNMNAPAEYVSTLSQSRPGLEGRFELSHGFGEGKKIEVAPGFHISKTHVLGLSLPSKLFTLDWSVQPISKIEFSGTYFNGENAAGVGGLRQGFTVINRYRAIPVGAWGGWAQLSWIATQRLSFNTYAGQESDRASDLLSGGITRNRAYAANLIYRIGQNVLAGLEASQVRTTYLGSGNRLNNHYDLGLAYLF